MSSIDGKTKVRLAWVCTAFVFVGTAVFNLASWGSSISQRVGVVERNQDAGHARGDEMRRDISELKVGVAKISEDVSWIREHTR